MTISDHAKSIELEALRRAALNPEPFVSGLTERQRREVRLMLARRYDKLIDQYAVDTHELLAETIGAEYATPALAPTA